VSTLETVLYADVLFAINFSMDFISLWAAALLGCKPRRALRMSAAAALGGIYAVVSIVAGIHGFWQYISAAVASFIMCLISFGKCGGMRGILKQSALIWGCGALLGGLMTAVLSLGRGGNLLHTTEGGSVWIGAAAAAVGAVYITVRLITAKKGAGPLPVRIEFAGNHIRFDALCDSGNLMRDPISGDPVILLSAALGKKLVGSENTRALLTCDAEKLSNSGIRFRLIPIKNSTGGSLCAAFRPDKVTTGSGRREESVQCLIALSDCTAVYFGGFPATAPASIAS
jgi:stage II sporulation protein GA (sporulation sigma-E factor processing peptidase)